MRCKEEIVESKSLLGTVLINWYVPATGTKPRGALCGNCGLLFREFMVPELLDDPVYRETAAKLRSAW